MVAIFEAEATLEREKNKIKSVFSHFFMFSYKSFPKAKAKAKAKAIAKAKVQEPERQ